MKNNLTEYAVLYRFKFSGKIVSVWTDCVDTRKEAEDDAKTHYDDGCKIVGIYSIDIFGGSVTLLENGDKIMARIDDENKSEEDKEDDRKYGRESDGSAYGVGSHWFI